MNTGMREVGMNKKDKEKPEDKPRDVRVLRIVSTQKIRVPGLRGDNVPVCLKSPDDCDCDYHDKFTEIIMLEECKDMTNEQKRLKISEGIPEMLTTLQSSTTSRHQWQTAKHTIVHEMDLETRTETVTRGCCHEGLEGRLNSSTKGCARDLPGTENFRTNGDGENSECSGHSHSCSADSHEECPHENAPCDCCRHGHSLTSFVRSPDDCRTCLRHMGGNFVNPKYSQIKQRMLKTLKDRQKEPGAENTEAVNKMPKPEAPAVVKTIPCGKKEKLIILRPENNNENVDELVRMIEGTKITNDPKKAAKKARQKERKEQMKLEEERQREEEERRIREYEERIRREQQEREEEEKRKIEEQKRQARRQKKKNRKKRDAEKSDDYMSAPDSTKNDPISLAVTSPSEAVRKVLETVQPTPEISGDKPRMVTIRRHPATPDNQNVVTITLSDDKEGKSPVYMLVNGHLVSGDNVVTNQPKVTSVEEHDESACSDKKKKNKKKKKTSIDETESCAFQQQHQGMTVLPTNEISVRTSLAIDNQGQPNPHVELEHLNLPPGITITKVPSINKEPTAETRASIEKVQTFAANVGQQSYYHPDDDDFFGRKENEEFEEVVSNKTRRKRIKAAKTKDRDGSEETDTRESPNSVKQMSRRTFVGDSKPADKIGDSNSQYSKWNGSTKGAKVGLKKGVPIHTVKQAVNADHNTPPKTRRDYSSRYVDGCGQSYSPTGHSVPVMPRLCRTQIRNGDCQDTNAYELAENKVKMTCYEHPTKVSSVSIENRAQEGGFSNLQQEGFEITPTTQTFSSVHHAPSHVNQQQAYNQSSWSQNQVQQPAVPVNVNNIQKVIQRPCSIQSDSKEESWSPWKDWSEHSTPEHPSARFGLDQGGKDLPPKIFAFQDLINRTNPSRKSPIQRPVHGQVEINSMPSNNVYENPYFARDVQGSQPPSYQQPMQGGGNLFQFHQRPESALFSSSNHVAEDLSVIRRQQEQDNMSWNSFSGVQPAYLQRRPSDKADLVVTQTIVSPSAPDPTWDRFSGTCSPYSVTPDHLHRNAMSNTASTIPTIPMHSYDPYRTKQAQQSPNLRTFPCAPQNMNWQAPMVHSLQQTGFEFNQQGPPHWNGGNPYSHFMGGVP